MDGSSPEESRAKLDELRALSDAFYRKAVFVGVHAFIEHAGLMNEHIKALARAVESGFDIHEVNEHLGRGPKFKGYEAGYLAEKFGCIFAPMFTPETWLLFESEMRKKITP